jgi:hypothetical protein
VRGSMARISSMMGVMREILVRHRGCDYTKEVWVLTTRQLGVDGELHESSHSQVCQCSIDILSNANARCAASLHHASRT